MFKRANKITSLLIAAAAVVSLVPANAADVKKINSEDGTVYNAVAYADGKAYVDGEINDDEAAYYVEDGGFTELEDVDSGDDVALFGEKYIDVEDGDYTIDLDAGTVNDDNITEDTADDAASALRKEIKDDTDDRYEDDSTVANNSGEIKDEGDGTDPSELNVIPGAKYGATWYATTYAQKDGESVNGNGTESPDLNVYTDTDGNYIDADYNVGKIKVTTTSGSVEKTVTIENTNDGYDDANGGDETVKASVSQIKVLTQDADYIYRLVKVTITSPESIREINGVDLGTIDAAKTVFTTDGTTAADGTSNTVIYNAIQKISKEADSGDVDGANYAKTVTTYAFSDDDGKELGGLEDATIEADNDDTYFTIAGGKLIAYTTAEKGNVEARAYTLKSSSGYYYADEEDRSSEDCEVSSEDDKTAAVQVDVDGNLWRLDGGYIYKFDNTDDWDKVYKVDGSFDELSVYDEDNMIAWSEDDEVYSLIGGTSATDEDDTTVETPVVTTGWVNTAAGWTFYDATGTQVAGQWVNAGGVWYMIKADGIMATGWYNDNGTWYFLNGSGAMQTGWLNDNGTWYYLNASGAMAANTTVDGYVLGASGAWIQ